MESAGSFDQYIFGFGNIGIGHAAVDRACCSAFLVVKKSDAFGAFVGRNIIDVLSQRRAHRALEFGGLAAFVNRLVRASRQAGPTVDTFFSNESCHFLLSHALSQTGCVRKDTRKPPAPEPHATLSYRLLD